MNHLIFFFLFMLHFSLYETSCTLAGECFEIEDSTCASFSGHVNPSTCLELGKTMGSCCVGTCFSSTPLFCAGIGGIWDPTSTCPCSPPTSCCIDGFCNEIYTESQCVENGGVFAEKQCAQDWCHETYGACCNGETCYELPSGYCQGAFVEGKACDEVCPVDDVVLDTSVTVDGADGRCCLADGCEETTSEVCIGELGGLFEDGVGCNPSNPCFRWGACLRAGLCLNPVQQSICDAYSGTFLEGGVCPDEEMGICIYRDNRYCSPFSEMQCGFLRGEWNGTITQCPEGFPPLGSCCIGGACIYTNERTCRLQSQSWKEGELCDPGVPCISGDFGSCCIFGLCVGTGNEQTCSAAAFNNGEVLGESDKVIFTPGLQCSGICGGGDTLSISLKRSEFIKIEKSTSLSWDSLDIKIEGEAGSDALFDSGDLMLSGTELSLTKIGVNISSLATGNSSDTKFVSSIGAIDILQISESSVFTITGAELEIGSLSVDPLSTMKLSRNNKLTVSSCSEIRGKLNLEVTAEDRGQLESDGELQIQYMEGNCITANSYEIDGDLDTECTTSSISTDNNLILILSFTPNCQEKTSEPEANTESIESTGSILSSLLPLLALAFN